MKGEIGLVGQKGQRGSMISPFWIFEVANFFFSVLLAKNTPLTNPALAGER